MRRAAAGAAGGMPTFHRVIIGDSRRMDVLGDGSVHLVVTSPPYWQLKDYGSGGQIGFHHSYEDYINNLDLVWNECIRVLHPGCRLCINIGDQFARSVYYGRYKVIPIRTEIIKFCESARMDYMGAVIWRKVTTCNTTGGATIMGSFPYPRNGILKLDYEFILIFKKPGEAPRPPQEAKERSRLSTREWNEYFAGHWTFPGEKQKGHLAMFPVELPRRLIRMFTFEGETVLDPFLGSGTTSLAALELDRHSVGYEINEEFLPTINGRLVLAACRQKAVIETEVAVPPALDLEKAIARLPYIFHDPLAMDKRPGPHPLEGRGDPRGSDFGSRMAAGPGAGERPDSLFPVREVLSPELLVLGDGRKVRLLGVRGRSGREAEAVRFLTDATRGQKVFLRNERPEQFIEGAEGRDRGTGEASVAAYVYLRNRTFLNAHLLKRGLAEPDASEHPMRERFRAYQKG